MNDFGVIKFLIFSLFSRHLGLDRVYCKRVMLTTSNKDEEWENCYESATDILKSNNRHFEYIQNIYNSPEKYSMWWFQQHCGNFCIRGSTSAKQNHSSVRNYLGVGLTLSILENVRKLMDRHIEHNKERCRQSNGRIFPLLLRQGYCFLGAAFNKDIVLSQML